MIGLPLWETVGMSLANLVLRVLSYPSLHVGEKTWERGWNLAQ